MRRHLDEGTDLPAEPWGDYVLIARPADALAAAAAVAGAAGYTAVSLGDAVEGEAREVAARHADTAKAALARGEKTALVSGGELTVTIAGDGTGGPSHEYVLALMLACGGDPRLSGMACDTDGIDGATEAAGAWFDAGTLARADLGRRRSGRGAPAQRRGRFFSATSRQIVSGPTRTNVNDLRVILIDGHASG